MVIKVGDYVKMNESIPDHGPMKRGKVYYVYGLSDSGGLMLRDVETDQDIPLPRYADCFYLTQDHGGPW